MWRGEPYGGVEAHGALDGEIARLTEQRVVAQQALIDADLDAGTELGALRLHLPETTIEDPLLHLELGDAVPQQPADAIGAFEHHDVVTRPGQLLGGSQAGLQNQDEKR